MILPFSFTSLYGTTSHSLRSLTENSGFETPAFVPLLLFYSTFHSLHLCWIFQEILSNKYELNFPHILILFDLLGSTHFIIDIKFIQGGNTCLKSWQHAQINVPIGIQFARHSDILDKIERISQSVVFLNVSLTFQRQCY